MIYFWLMIFLFSCSAPYYQDVAMHLSEGRFEEAEKSLPTHGDSPLLLLSKAMVGFQSGKYEKSAQDFEKALDAIDYYQQQSAPEIAGQTLLQDDIGAYVPPLFEQSLARVYQALSFLHLNQEDNAAATLYYLENHQPHENPLVAYLLATLFQRRGDVSNARVLFSRLKLEGSNGNVLLIHHRGAAPYKKSEIAPVSIVSAFLLEQILQIEDVGPALSTLTGISIPVLHSQARPNSFITVQNLLQPTLRYDIDQAADTTLDQEMPWIAARAAARLLIRRGAVAATQERYQPFMDVAMLISNIATRADIRSWTSLPSCIDLYHLDLAPGEHELLVGRQKLTIQVSSKNLTVIEVFQPTTNKVHLPKECI